MFVHAPGLKVVMPSSAADFKGLLKTAIRDNNPVLFFMDLALAHTPGTVPAAEEGDHLVPLGRASVLRAGRDVTLVSYAKTVGTCLQAADSLAAQGVSAEVLDLRSLKPLDEAAVLASVRKTGRLVVVHEANRLCGVGAEVAALVKFSRLNLLDSAWSVKEPVDAIFCRNVMIYMDLSLQKKLIPMFHYALNPNGIMFLGNSEGIGAYESAFTVLDSKAKLYRRRSDFQSPSRPEFRPPT
eukprot:gene61290-81706_t